MQTMYIYIYRNILPINDFKIVILGYCVHLFGLVAFIRFQCPILNASCNFQSLWIGDYFCLNFFNKVFIIFKVHPCTLWDETPPPLPPPHARIPIMPNDIS
jgi:hypothetical protein